MKMSAGNMATLLVRLHMAFTVWASHVLGKHWNQGTNPTQPMARVLVKLFMDKVEFPKQKLTMKIIDEEFRVIQTGEEIYGFYNQSQDTGE